MNDKQTLITATNDNQSVFTRKDVELCDGKGKNKSFVVYRNHVYDICKYVKSHPGGIRILQEKAGGDITEDYEDIGHSSEANQILEGLKVGSLATKDEWVYQSSNKWNKPLALQSAQEIAKDTYEFHFTWEVHDSIADLIPGGHVMLTLDSDCSRAYTPVGFDARQGTMVLAIKLYPKGKMSDKLRAVLDRRESNSDYKPKATFSGPFGRLEYSFETGDVFTLTRSKRDNDSLSCKPAITLCAGGTGITPFIRALRLTDFSKVDFKINLVYFVKVADEIMYKEEIESYVNKFPEKFSVTFALSDEIPQPTEDSNIHNDYKEYLQRDISPERVHPILFRNEKTSTVVVCGPPKMEESLTTSISKSYPEIRIATSTLGAGQSENDSKRSSGISYWARHHPNMIYYISSFIVPLFVIWLNGGIPVSWPHTDARGDDAVGMGGKFPIDGFGTKNLSYTIIGNGYKLRNPTIWTIVSPWVGYMIHQIVSLWILYKAKQERPAFSKDFRWFNWQLLYVNLIGIAAKFVQNFFWYEGLSTVLPLGFGVGTTFMFLAMVFLMMVPIRGIVFGYGTDFNFLNEAAYFVREHHWFLINFTTVNEVWFHPFESTIGHLFGLFNVVLLTWQTVCVYTVSHVNAWWCLAIESTVVLHGFFIGYNRGTPGAPGAFGFGFLFVFIVTEIYGVSMPRLARILLSLVSLAGCLIFYGLELQGEGIGFNKIYVVLQRVPPLYYGALLWQALLYNFAYVPASKIKVDQFRWTTYTLLCLLFMTPFFVPFILLVG